MCVEVELVNSEKESEIQLCTQNSKFTGKDFAEDKFQTQPFYVKYASETVKM